MGEARIAVSTEVALENASIFGAVEECAPGFEFAHALGGFLCMQLCHAPVVEVLAAAHRVGEMNAPVVAVVYIGEGCGDAAFSHHGVGFAEERFADDSDFCSGGCGFNGGAQACA